MQVSVEASGLERRVTIGVPATDIEPKIIDRLKKIKQTVRIDGFRKGKVPNSLVAQRYRGTAREEVLGEVIQTSLYTALQQESLLPAGQPVIEPKQMDDGADLEFVAVFEVYPEIELNALDSIQVNKQVVDIADADVDGLISKLQHQHATWHSVERAAADGDRLVIDYKGTKDGEAFEGGTAEDHTLELGSNSFIPGFEEGLVGAEVDQTLTLDLTFPEEYHAEALAGQQVAFEVKVKKIEAAELPELDDEFVAKFGVNEGGLDALKTDVRSNMQRELDQRLRANVKQQVMDGLLGANSIEVPKALVADEIKQMREQAKARFGGQNPQGLPDLPDDVFAEQAQRRVSLGLLLGEVIKTNELKPEAERVREFIENMASAYEQPDDVINWYYSNKEQLQQVESLVLEEQAVDTILSQAQVAEAPASFDEVMNAN